MATVREYIDAKLSRFGLELSGMEMTVLLESVEADDDTIIRPDSLIQAKTAIANIIPELLLMPTKVTEGGMSIERNTAAITAYYTALCGELGLTNALVTAAPTVVDRSYLW